MDIVINRRLWASEYQKLNDPMEGQYLDRYQSLSHELIKALSGYKENTRICSLSANPEDVVMWSLYADGHQGVVVGVDIDINKYSVKPVFYTGLQEFPERVDYISTDTAIDILTHKLREWSYEREHRVFTHGSNFVYCSIRQLILGQRVGSTNKSLIKKIVNKIDPRIEIVELNLMII